MSENLTKELLFGDECRTKLLKGIETLSKAVKSTLGPSGSTVILESVHQTHGITVTKDGVTVARNIELIDPVENMGVRVLKQAAEETARESGDGTSTAVVLAEAMIIGGTQKITPDINRTSVLRCMDEIVEDIISDLKSKAITCDEKILLQIATISANNDSVIGELVSKTYNEVGEDGIVTIDKSMTYDTYAEVINALRIERGYSSPLFINHREKDECIMEDVRILVCDTEIRNFMQIDQILKPIIQEKMKLLIIAPCHNDVINTMAANVTGGRINVCIISPPNFGYRQHELMEDIALNVGATFFSQKTGDDLSLLQFNHLGVASKIIINRGQTLIFGGKGEKELLNSRVTELQGAYELATKKQDKDFINQRIASLVGGIGIIYVGGNTDMEQKELYDRVEDSVCAVKSALKEGIIAGAGKSLYEVRQTVKNPSSKEYQIASDIIFEAIKIPLIQILANADLDYKDIYNTNNKDGYGYNVKTGQYGDLIEMGVIDPLLVTRTALKNAVSVAITILSTNTSINISRA